MLQFEAMAIGGLSACFLFRRVRLLYVHWLFSTPAQLVLMSLILIKLFFHRFATEFSSLYAVIFDQPVFTPLLLMVIFAWFILNVAANPRSVVRFESRALNYLGDISYGIYMYHALAISLVFVPLRDDYQEAPFLSATLLLHVSVAALTLLFAALSKTFFENKFLRHKQRFQATRGKLQSIGAAEEGGTAPGRAMAA